MANFMDITSMIVGGAFGADWTLFAIIALGVIAIIAFKWRLPVTIALGMAWSVVYGFYVINATAGSPIQMILALLTVAVAISIVSSLMKLGNRSQQ